MTDSQGGAARGDHVTEDEAALYDRQIRLWGLEAQGRIRKAHVVVLNLDGLTTEAVKNWVLAGIARLTLVDARPTVQEHDLAAGFFWRSEDIGGERLPPAAARIQALNPLVRIDVLPSTAMRSILDPLSSSLHNLQASVVVVGVPSGPKAGARMWTGSSLMTLNDVCRKEGVPFYAMGSQGLGGWAFNDLGDAHEYVVERPDVNLAIPKTAVESAARHTAENGALASTNGFSSATHATTAPSGKRLEKRKQAFVPLRTAAAHSWTGLSRAQLRRSKPVPGLVAILALWRLSDEPNAAPITASALEESMRALAAERGLDEELVLARQPPGTTFASVADDLVQMALMHEGEFSPVCAMLGGVVSQDVLNALGGREEPFVNWFHLDAMQGAGPVYALGTPPHTVM